MKKSQMYCLKFRENKFYLFALMLVLFMLGLNVEGRPSKDFYAILDGKVAEWVIIYVKDGTLYRDSEYNTPLEEGEYKSITIYDNDGTPIEFNIDMEDGDLDHDGDRMSDDYENGNKEIIIHVLNDQGEVVEQKLESNELHTSPAMKDTDGDGVSDGEEIWGYKNDWEERSEAYRSNPNDADSDKDGINDGIERTMSYNPGHPVSSTRSFYAYADEDPDYKQVWQRDGKFYDAADGGNSLSNLKNSDKTTPITTETKDGDLDYDGDTISNKTEQAIGYDPAKKASSERSFYAYVGSDYRQVWQRDGGFYDAAEGGNPLTDLKNSDKTTPITAATEDGDLDYDGDKVSNKNEQVIGYDLANKTSSERSFYAYVGSDYRQVWQRDGKFYDAAEGGNSLSDLKNSDNTTPITTATEDGDLDYDGDTISNKTEQMIGYDPSNETSSERSFYAYVGSDYIQVWQHGDKFYDAAEGGNPLSDLKNSDKTTPITTATEDGDLDYDGDELTYKEEIKEGLDPLMKASDPRTIYAFYYENTADKKPEFAMFTQREGKFYKGTSDEQIPTDAFLTYDQKDTSKRINADTSDKIIHDLKYGDDDNDGIQAYCEVQMGYDPYAKASSSRKFYAYCFGENDDFFTAKYSLIKQENGKFYERNKNDEWKELTGGTVLYKFIDKSGGQVTTTTSDGELDYDGDGVKNSADADPVELDPTVDSDEDGITNVNEIILHTDFNNKASVSRIFYAYVNDKKNDEDVDHFVYQRVIQKDKKFYNVKVVEKEEQEEVVEEEKVVEVVVGEEIAADKLKNCDKSSQISTDTEDGELDFDGDGIKTKDEEDMGYDPANPVSSTRSFYVTFVRNEDNNVTSYEYRKIYQKDGKIYSSLSYSDEDELKQVRYTSYLKKKDGELDYNGDHVCNSDEYLVAGENRTPLTQVTVTANPLERVFERFFGPFFYASVKITDNASSEASSEIVRYCSLADISGEKAPWTKYVIKVEDGCIVLMEKENNAWKYSSTSDYNKKTFVVEDASKVVMRLARSKDYDGDGLSNNEEVDEEVGVDTDPILWDTDNDGFSDGVEVNHLNTSPIDPTSPWVNNALDLVTGEHERVQSYVHSATHKRYLQAYTVTADEAAKNGACAEFSDIAQLVGNMQNYTVEFYVRFENNTSWPSDAPILQKVPKGELDNSEFYIGVDKDGRLNIKFYCRQDGYDVRKTWKTNLSFEQKAWYRIAVSFKQEGMEGTQTRKFIVQAYQKKIEEGNSSYKCDRLDMNGILASTYSIGTLKIGGWAEDKKSSLSMMFDELRFWDNDDAEEVIKANADAEIPGIQRECDWQTGATYDSNALQDKGLAFYSQFNFVLCDPDKAANETYQLNAAARYCGDDNKAVGRVAHDLNVELACVLPYSYSDGSNVKTFDTWDNGDSDGNGLPDWWELYFFAQLGNDPDDDDDDDQLNNKSEYILFSKGADPLDPNSLYNFENKDKMTEGSAIKDGNMDSDGDGLTNSLEQAYGTNPYVVDTDDDGCGDMVEITLNSSPTSSMSVVTYKEDVYGEIEDNEGKKSIGVIHHKGDIVKEEWEEVKDTDFLQYTVSRAKQMALDLSALESDINLPNADRFACSKRKAVSESALMTQTGDFTFELWVKSSGDYDGKDESKREVIFETRAEDSDWGWRFLLEDGCPKGEIVYYQSKDDTAEGEIKVHVGGIKRTGAQGDVAAAKLEKDVWTHIALVWHPGQNCLSMYRDKTVYISSWKFTYDVDLGTVSKFARIKKQEKKEIQIDELRFWSCERTAQQIAYWADRVIPSRVHDMISYIPVNSLYNPADRLSTRSLMMLTEYPLLCNFRFDDQGDSAEDFAWFNGVDNSVKIPKDAFVSSGDLVVSGEDDVDGDAIPEWWIRLYNQNCYPNYVENDPQAGINDLPGMRRCNVSSGWKRGTELTGIVWKDSKTIDYFAGTQYGIGFAPVGGNSFHSSTNGVARGYAYSTGLDEGVFVSRAAQLNKYMAYVSMHKYIYVKQTPVSAKLNLSMYGIQNDGALDIDSATKQVTLYVNKKKVTVPSQGGEIEIAKYMKAGRNQIALHFKRSATGVTYSFVAPDDQTKIEYVIYSYAGAMDVALNVDNEDLIVFGQDWPFDPRSVWYYAATTVGSANHGANFHDGNNYYLFTDYATASISESADSYGILLDQDGDGIDILGEYQLGTNPKDKDSDNNGIEDGDEDRDGDGICNAYEDSGVIVEVIRDGEPKSLFMLFVDTDRDGVVDHVADYQGMGVVEATLNIAGKTAIIGGNSYNVVKICPEKLSFVNPDTDNDGLSDGEEVKYLHSNPVDAEHPWINRAVDLGLEEHTNTGFTVDPVTETLKFYDGVTKNAASTPYVWFENFNGKYTKLASSTIEFWFELLDDEKKSTDDEKKSTDDEKKITGTLVQKTAEQVGEIPDFRIYLKAGKLYVQINYIESGSSDKTVKQHEWEVKYLDADNTTEKNIEFTESNKGLWQHIAVTYNQVGSGYFNVSVIATVKTKTAGGEVQESEIVTSYENGNCTGKLKNQSSNGDLVVGDLDNVSDRLSVKIDELRIWNCVRTNTQIAATRNCELLTTPDDMALYVKFNSNTADNKIYATDGTVGQLMGGAELSVEMPTDASQGHEYLTGDNDGDNLPDWWEYLYFGHLGQTAEDDPDNDGLNNSTEFLLYGYGADPTRAYSLDKNWRKTDGEMDSDNDGLTNRREQELKTNPAEPDTDKDGVKDGIEVNKFIGIQEEHYDPLETISVPRTFWVIDKNDSSKLIHVAQREDNENIRLYILKEDGTIGGDVSKDYADYLTLEDGDVDYDGDYIPNAIECGIGYEPSERASAERSFYAYYGDDNDYKQVWQRDGKFYDAEKDGNELKNVWKNADRTILITTATEDGDLDYDGDGVSNAFEVRMKYDLTKKISVDRTFWLGLSVGDPKAVHLHQIDMKLYKIRDDGTEEEYTEESAQEYLTKNDGEVDYDGDGKPNAVDNDPYTPQLDPDLDKDGVCNEDERGMTGYDMNNKYSPTRTFWVYGETFKTCHLVEKDGVLYIADSENKSTGIKADSCYDDYLSSKMKYTDGELDYDGDGIANKDDKEPLTPDQTLDSNNDGIPNFLAITRLGYAPNPLKGYSKYRTFYVYGTQLTQEGDTLYDEKHHDVTTEYSDYVTMHDADVDYDGDSLANDLEIKLNYDLTAPVSAERTVYTYVYMDEMGYTKVDQKNGILYVAGTNVEIPVEQCRANGEVMYLNDGEVDFDGDGIANALDDDPLTPSPDWSEMSDTDSLCDYLEILMGYDPKNEKSTERSFWISTPEGRKFRVLQRDGKLYEFERLDVEVTGLNEDYLKKTDDEVDYDGDGITNGEEIKKGTDPMVYDIQPNEGEYDPDGDGIPTYIEWMMMYDPARKISLSRAYFTYVEGKYVRVQQNGSTVTLFGDDVKITLDEPGVLSLNDGEVDYDGDGVANATEIEQGTDPMDGIWAREGVITIPRRFFVLTKDGEYVFVEQREIGNDVPLYRVDNGEVVELDENYWNVADWDDLYIDWDGDGLDNQYEQEHGFSTHNPDSDGDGLDDAEEHSVLNTDPMDPMDPYMNRVLDLITREHKVADPYVKDGHVDHYSAEKTILLRKYPHAEFADFDEGLDMQNCTIGFWFALDYRSGLNGRLLRKKSAKATSSKGDDFDIYMNNGVLTIKYAVSDKSVSQKIEFPKDAVQLSESGDCNDLHWYHLAVVFNQKADTATTDCVVAYLYDPKQQTTTVKGNSQGTLVALTRRSKGTLFVGDDTGVAGRLSMVMDDICFWKRALTFDEVQSTLSGVDTTSSTSEALIFALNCDYQKGNTIYASRGKQSSSASVTLVENARISLVKSDKRITDFEVGVRTYSGNSTCAYIGNPADVLSAVIMTSAVDPTGNAVSYRFFWIKTDEALDEGDFSYDKQTGTLVYKNTQTAIGGILSCARELDLANEGRDLKAGDKIQLMAVALKEDDEALVLDASDCLELKNEDGSDGPLDQLVTSASTHVSPSSSISVKVTNPNDVGGTVFIEWYRNMVLVKTDNGEVGANGTTTLTMSDRNMVADGDVWSYIVWIENSDDRSHESVVTEDDTLRRSRSTDLSNIMVGSGYSGPTEDSYGTEVGAPTTPTSVTIYPETLNPSTIPYAVATGSKCSTTFGYYFQWYRKSKSATTYTMVEGQTMPYWRSTHASLPKPDVSIEYCAHDDTLEAVYSSQYAREYRWEVQIKTTGTSWTNIQGENSWRLSKLSFEKYNKIGYSIRCLSRIGIPNADVYSPWGVSNVITMPVVIPTSTEVKLPCANEATMTAAPTITEASSDILATGDSLYCKVYAMNIYGQKSLFKTSPAVSITASTSGSTGLLTYYEPNNLPEDAKPIYSKTSWMNTSSEDTNIQTHTFNAKTDQDWVRFVVPEMLSRRKWLINFETNTGTMYQPGYTKNDFAHPATSVFLYGPSTSTLKAGKEICGNSGSSNSVFGRIVNQPLEPGIYFVMVSPTNKNTNIDLGVQYEMHFYMEQQTDDENEIRWDDEESIPQLTPVEPAIVDDLTVTLNTTAHAGNGKLVTQYYYLWYRDGEIVPFNGAVPVNEYMTNTYMVRNAVLNLTTIPASMTNAGETWYCEIYPYTEKYGYGLPLMSNAVVIGDTGWNMDLTAEVTFQNEDDEILYKSNSITLAWHENGTFGYDPSLDKESASSDIFFSIPFDNTHTGFSRDVHPYGRSSSWYMQVTIPADEAEYCTGVTISWPSKAYPLKTSGNMTLCRVTKRYDGYYEKIAGTSKEIKEFTSGSMTLSRDVIENLQKDDEGNYVAYFRLTIGSEVSLQTIKLVKGWNLVSLPFTPINSNVNDVFVDSAGLPVYSGTIREFRKWRYYDATDIVATRGYWLYAKDKCTINVYGSAVTDTIPLSEGWNIFGPVYSLSDFVSTYKKICQSSVGQIYDEDKKKTVYMLYKFDPNAEADGQVPVSIEEDGRYPVEVGKGYWIYMEKAATLPVINEDEE